MLFATFHSDLEVVAGGGECTPRLQRELQVYAMMPLSEARAEGWHRTVQLHHTRACAAKIPWLLSSNRLPFNLRLAKRWISTRSGCVAFRKAWFSCKQLLQTKLGRRRLLRPTRASTKVFRERLCRLEDYAREKWSKLVGTELAPCVDPNIDHYSRMWQREYLRCVIARAAMCTVEAVDRPYTRSPLEAPLPPDGAAPGTPVDTSKAARGGVLGFRYFVLGAI